MTAPRIRIHTLGCKVNQCDADEMARALAARGYRVVGPGRPADVCIINTCTVTNTADAKARKLVRRLARSNPGAAVIVTGCWAQRDPEGVAAALPEADAVVPNTRKWEIADIIANFAPASSASLSPAPRSRTRAFLKIQDGCDHRCAYCIVPHVRGAPASTSMPEVVERVEALAQAGVKELVLCGIRLGAYGRDRAEASLASLLRALRDAAIPRLRLSSIEPMDLDPGLLAEIADHPTLCHHLHLPLQSGDDEILAAMGRGYTTDDFAALTSRVRQAWSDAAITTDVIVGFPGEADEQFARSLRFIGEMRFSRLHVFPYSPRPGTPAADRPRQVPTHTVRERTARMLALADDLAAAAARQWIGREVEVLFEERDRAGHLTGLTPHYLRVHAPGPDDWLGRIVTVAPSRERNGDLHAEA